MRESDDIRRFPRGGLLRSRLRWSSQATEAFAMGDLGLSYYRDLPPGPGGAVAGAVSQPSVSRPLSGGRQVLLLDVLLRETRDCAVPEAGRPRAERMRSRAKQRSEKPK